MNTRNRKAEIDRPGILSGGLVGVNKHWGDKGVSVYAKMCFTLAAHLRLLDLYDLQ